MKTLWSIDRKIILASRKMVTRKIGIIGIEYKTHKHFLALCLSIFAKKTGKLLSN